MAVLAAAWIDFANILLKKGHYCILLLLCLTSVILLSIVLTHTSAPESSYVGNLTKAIKESGILQGNITPDSSPENTRYPLSSTERDS